MRTTNFLLILVSVLAFLIGNLYAQVTDTFNGIPFHYRITLGEKNSDYQLFHIEFPSPLPSQVPENNTVYAEYYLPSDYLGGRAGYPAVICLHILDGNLELTRLFCIAFAKSGIAAIMPPLPFYGKRRPADWQRWEKMLISTPQGPEIFFTSVEQGIQDIRRTVDFLCSRTEIARDKIGILGISLGGITAALAMEKEERLSKGALLLAGGDLETIMNASPEAAFLKKLAENYPPGREAFLKRLKTIDPLTNAAALWERGVSGRIMVCYAEQDEVIPSSCTLRLASAAGIPEENLICIKNASHYTAAAELPQVLDLCCQFFDGKIQENRTGELSGIETKIQENRTEELSGIEKTPRYVTTVRLVGSLLKGKIPEGKGVHVQMEFDFQEKEKNISGKIDFLLGSGRRFKLSLEIPGICEKLSLGHADYPWLISMDGTVFMGTMKTDPTADFRNYLVPDIALFFKMVSATCDLIVLYPKIIERLVSIQEVKERMDGTICYDISDRKRTQVQLVINEKDATPLQIRITKKSSDYVLKIRKWVPNSDFPDSVFEPSSSVKRMEVEQKQLHRFFAAFANHVVELSK